MNLECKEPVKYICPKCGYAWYTKAKRPKCSKCDYTFPFRKTATKTAKTATKTAIQDNIMQGDILDAMDQANIDPMNNKKVIKDYIPLLLDDDKLEFALAKACKERKRGAKTIIKKALRTWLKDEGFL